MTGKGKWYRVYYKSKKVDLIFAHSEKELNRKVYNKIFYEEE